MVHGVLDHNRSWLRHGPEWRADVNDIVAAMDKPECVHAYIARLPAIVGFVPADEQSAFSSFVPDGLNGSDKDFISFRLDCQDTARLWQLLPQTMAAIVNDATHVSDGQAELGDIELRRQTVACGEVPYFYGLHTDIGADVDIPSSAQLPTYMICDTQPTQAYQGPAALYLPDSRSVRLLTDSLDLSRNLAQAPRYGIVRLSFATVHTAPVFDNDDTRTFMRVFTRPA